MRSALTFSFITMLAITSAPAGVDDGRPITVGTVVAYHAETPHPYPRGLAEGDVVWTDRVFADKAEFLRVHFDRFSLAAGDYVTVSSPDGQQQWRYDGRGPNGEGDLWSFTIDGDTAVVELHAARQGGHGYRIDAIAYGTSVLGRNIVPRGEVPEVTRLICGGSNELEQVACHSDSFYDASVRATARLQFVSGGLVKLCTGWLIDGSKANMMITNNHCVSTKPEVLSVQAKFNYQFTDCAGTNSATTTDYAGKAFVKTNSDVDIGFGGGLDYTLFTLSGKPEADWGELIPTTIAHSVDEQFWIVGHPAGLEKRTSYWDDAGFSHRCTSGFVDRTYIVGAGQPTAANTQIGYLCDTQGGSSGSAVIMPSTGHVFALHHLGGVNDCDENGICTLCLNAATEMSYICADAGSLLNCQPN